MSQCVIKMQVFKLVVPLEWAAIGRARGARMAALVRARAVLPLSTLNSVKNTKCSFGKKCNNWFAINYSCHFSEAGEVWRRIWKRGWLIPVLWESKYQLRVRVCDKLFGMHGVVFFHVVHELLSAESHTHNEVCFTVLVSTAHRLSLDYIFYFPLNRTITQPVDIIRFRSKHDFSALTTEE